ncbi:unnamed protein product [Paramecium sonneborni]|uniref:Uncharacterized protein n=1 Tax=Paramecium sonneborni TaxID=65129 RepID=A0A8S1QE98_9CILI|nr:unnamed protein product [Paramecium sonneborni]
MVLERRFQWYEGYFEKICDLLEQKLMLVTLMIKLKLNSQLLLMKKQIVNHLDKEILLSSVHPSQLIVLNVRDQKDSDCKILFWRINLYELMDGQFVARFRYVSDCGSKSLFDGFRIFGAVLDFFDITPHQKLKLQLILDKFDFLDGEFMMFQTDGVEIWRTKLVVQIYVVKDFWFDGISPVKQKLLFLESCCLRDFKQVYAPLEFMLLSKGLLLQKQEN